jgi:hypothetical protein
VTPFTSAQKASIRRYMGWSARFHQVDTALEQAMSAVEGEPHDATYDLIDGWLAQLADINTRITDAYGRLKAKVVGSITLPGHDEIGMLRSEGRRIVGQMAATFGVEVRHDAFSSRTSGGNYFRHG